LVFKYKVIKAAKVSLDLGLQVQAAQQARCLSDRAFLVILCRKWARRSGTSKKRRRRCRYSISSHCRRSILSAHLQNVLATPHIGYGSRSLYETFYRDAVANIRSWFLGNEGRLKWGVKQP